MEAGLETRFDGNPLHFRILTGYAGLCRQQWNGGEGPGVRGHSGSLGGRGWDGETVVDWGLWGIDLENYYAPTYSLCVSNPRNEGA